MRRAFQVGIRLVVALDLLEGRDSLETHGVNGDDALVHIIRLSPVSTSAVNLSQPEPRVDVGRVLLYDEVMLLDRIIKATSSLEGLLRAGNAPEGSQA